MNRTTRRHSCRLLAGLGLLLTVAACGAGAAATEDAAAPGAPWSFGSEITTTIPMDVPTLAPSKEDPAAAPESVKVPALKATMSRVTAVETPPDKEFDPCSLLTLEEWVAAAQTDMSKVQQVTLEYGEACGWVAGGEDTLRVAAAVLGGNGFLPEGVTSEPLTVGDTAGTWSAGYPTADSSVLVLPVDGAELVIEVAARGGDAGRARDLALAVAPAMLGRVG